MNRAATLIVLALGAVLLLGATALYLTMEVEPATSTDEPLALAHENLNATLWMQSSAEYLASALQSYTLGRVMLDRALEDPTWSAALEQLSAGGYEELPPAVILDVDETVLDNSAYQARMVLDDSEFQTASWHEWVREEQAVPVPGALDFIRHAVSRGVTVFYVTNRRHEVEEPTRRNLAAYGFPIDAQHDTVLTRDEQEDWGSDKGTRRRAVGSEFRILLLLGDNFGDFISEVDTTVRERQRLASEYEEMWGTRWIVLPNPSYGSWDGAVIDYEYTLPLADKRRLKREALDPAR